VRLKNERSGTDSGRAIPLKLVIISVVSVMPIGRPRLKKEMAGTSPARTEASGAL
jgi:hypothetical protein